MLSYFKPQFSRAYRELQRAQAYQDASLVSSSFKLRMFELVAIACHNIAAELYTKAGGGLRKPACPPPPPPSSHPLIRPAPPNIAELFHDEYEEWRQYPNGVADVVGYWAEYRLFGGVVLFDRGTTGQEVGIIILASLRTKRCIPQTQFSQAYPVST